MRKLPIRPFMNRDENVLGYILRLANENFFDSLIECVKAYSSLSLSSRYSAKSLHSYIQFAELLTGRALSVHEITLAGEFSSDPAVVDAKRFAISRKPCICPSCIEEEGYIKSRWQYTVYSHCDKHQCELINVCPDCNRELVWNTALLKLCCQRCGAHLKSEKKEKQPLHIQKLNELTDSEKWKYASLLRQHATAFMRPFDMMDKRICEVPIMIRNWNELYSTIAEHIENKRDKPSPYLLLSNDKHDFGYKEYIQSPLAAGMRQVVKRPPTNEECRNFMDKKALLNWFGISEYHMQACLDMKYAKVLFKKAYCGSFIYDFRDWQKMFMNFRKLESGGVDIEDVASEAPVFWCHEEEVVVGVLRGKIPVRFKNPSAPNLKEAMVDRRMAHYYLSKQRTLIRGGVMSLAQAARALGINVKEVRQLIRDGVLEKYRTTNSTGLLTTKSVINAVKEMDFKHRNEILKDFPSLTSIK